jgi:anti-sigma factor RsiW
MTTRDEHVAIEELSAFADRDLAPARLAEIERHLAGCGECQREVQQIEALRRDLRGLAEAEPRRDLWPVIARARREPPRGSLLGWLRAPWALPAAALAGAAAALLVVFAVGRGPEAPPAPAPANAALAEVAKAEAVYRGAVARLQATLGQSRAYSPKARAVVARSLAEIDRAIERCRKALRQDPYDPDAQEAMLAAYQQKVDLLSDLVQETM